MFLESFQSSPFVWLLNCTPVDIPLHILTQDPECMIRFESSPGCPLKTKFIL